MENLESISPENKSIEDNTRNLIKVVNLDISKPIDIETSIGNLNGNKKLYFNMLAKLEGVYINKCMEQIASSIASNDWIKIKMATRVLKGASGYIGASKIHYACFYILEASKGNDYERMLEYYPFLVEAVIEYKRYSRRVLANYKCKYF